MKFPSIHSSTIVRGPEPPASLSLPAIFGEQLSKLYQLVQRSRCVFASPVGPFYAQARDHYLPRFVYFGPDASDASLRLSFLGGFDHRDLRPTLALLRLIVGLAMKPDLGQALNLSFFPLVDILGLARIAGHRQLAAENWTTAAAPEIGLLEKDARLRAYHGFVRLETGSSEDVVNVRLRAPAPVENAAPALELISSEDVAPMPIRWESESTADVRDGPLSMADDLPLRPFELTVRLPAAWPLDRYADAAASILKRFVLRYRGFISYAQYL